MFACDFLTTPRFVGTKEWVKMHHGSYSKLTVTCLERDIKVSETCGALQ
jgi:hypothetical protein